MNNFIIKAHFSSPIDLEKAKETLLDFGVSRDDIDYISSPRKNGEGLKFATIDKSSIYAVRLVVPSAILGVLIYYLSLSKTTSLDFLGTLFSTNFPNLLLTVLLFTFTGAFIGYLWGSRSYIHTVIFKEKNNKNANITLTVNTKYENIKSIKSKLRELAIKMTVSDANTEQEVNFRDQ